MAKGNSQKPSNRSTLDFEAQLWAAADKMRGHMDASECVVQVLVAMLEPTFLNYVGERGNNCYTTWQKFARSNI